MKMFWEVQSQEMSCIGENAFVPSVFDVGLDIVRLCNDEQSKYDKIMLRFQSIASGQWKELKWSKLEHKTCLNFKIR